MTAALQFGIAFVVVCAIGAGLLLTKPGQELVASFSSGRQAGRERREPPKISQAGVHGEGGAGLACPVCGGGEFKVARKVSTKLMFGAASLLGQARYVRCVTCGTRYRRG